MKKFLGIIIVAITLLSSCGPSLSASGEFGGQTYEGKFRDITIYRVTTPSGRALYLGVKDDGTLASTQYDSASGKSRIPVPVIILDGHELTITIDGQKVSKEQALKILGGSF